jgi:general secretion pathway protein K
LLNHHPNYRNKLQQRGAALLTALFIVAVVAGIAVLMATRQQINIRIFGLVMDNDRAYSYAQGVEDWAIGQLIQSGMRPPNSGVPDLFPALKPMKFADAIVSGIIQDQQGLFNINSLSDANNLPSFVRLLMTVDADLSNRQAATIALAINQWLTPSNADEYYSKLLPPYRAAHKNMANISELRLVAGITNKLFLELSPYITALPTVKNVINVSTAPPPILMTLTPTMSSDQAQSILQCRQSTHGFISLDAFNTCLTHLGLALTTNQQITVKSDYFLSIAQVTMGKQQLILYSLLYRFVQPQNKQVTVMVLWQSRDYNVTMAQQG